MYLYGASGHAKVIIDILRANNEKLEALFDDNEAIDSLLNYPVLRSSEVRGPLIISIGDNGIRRKIAESLHATFGNAFHPSAAQKYLWLKHWMDISRPDHPAYLPRSDRNNPEGNVSSLLLKTL